jgi:CRP-like cAMP-binding protein
MEGAHTRAKKPLIPATASRRRNLLLAALPSAEHRKLIARSELVKLAFGDVLCEQGERIPHVYFPIDSFISLISWMDERSRLEVGLVGAEGMLGVSLVLGVNVAPGRALVQGTGSALRVDATQFSRQIEQSPALEQTLKRYLYVVMSQLTRTAACTRFHLIEARLARWLLMTRDRANCDEFQLTHEVTAYMLGVRRESVTESASALQKRKLIRYKRGNVTVLDGPGLEAVACKCYAAATQIYAQILCTRSTPRTGMHA